MHRPFCNGSFVVHKTKKCFSSVALDRTHEQVIHGGVKGGAVRLTENPVALRRWTVASLELVQMVEEFEGNIPSAEDHHHREQKHGFQSAFPKD